MPTHAQLAAFRAALLGDASNFGPQASGYVTGPDQEPLAGQVSQAPTYSVPTEDLPTATPVPRAEPPLPSTTAQARDQWLSNHAPGGKALGESMSPQVQQSGLAGWRAQHGLAPDANLADTQGQAQQREIGPRAAAQLATGAGDQSQMMSLPPQREPVGPGASPLQYHAAGWDESRYPIRPGTEGLKQSALRDMATAEKDQARIQALGQRKEELLLRQQADALEDLNAQNAIREQNRRVLFDDARAKADKAASEASKLQVVPGRIFSDGGPGMAIMAALGGALGGFLQARTGGPNQFIETLNRLQDKDIDAQRTAIEQARYGADMQKNGLADLREQLGDDRAAEETYRQRQLQWMLTKVQAVRMNTSSEFTKKNADLVEAQLKDALASRLERRDQAIWRAAYTTGGGVPTGKLNTVTLPNGKTVAFQTEDDRKKVQERLLAQQDLGNIYGRVKALRAQLTPGFIASNPVEAYKIRADLDSLAERALPSWSMARGQGQVKAEEAERYKKNLFPFAAIADPSADRIIEGNVKENEDLLDNVVRAHGGEYVDKGYAQGAAGPTPTATYQGAAAAPKPKAPPSSFKPLGEK